MTIDSSVYSPCLGHFLLSVRWAKVSISSSKFNRSNSICFCQIVPKMNFSTGGQNNNAEISCEDSFFPDHCTSKQIFLFTNVTKNEKEEIDENEHNSTFDFFSFLIDSAENQWKVTLKNQLHSLINFISKEIDFRHHPTIRFSFTCSTLSTQIYFLPNTKQFHSNSKFTSKNSFQTADFT